MTALKVVPGKYHQPMATLEVALTDAHRVTYMVWAPNEKRAEWAANRTESRITDDLDDEGEPRWDAFDGSHEHATTFDAAVRAALFPVNVRRAFAKWAAATIPAPRS